MQDWGPEWDAVFDVVVVGSGTAGFAAAVAAANRGSRVVMFEKADQLGGTTAKSSAVMWLPNNPLMQRNGYEDRRPDALRYMAKVGFPDLYAPNAVNLGLPALSYKLLEAFYDNSPSAFEEFEDMGGIPYNAEAFPGYADYLAEAPENMAPVGRSISMKLPEDYDPERDASGGQRFVDAMRVQAERLGVEIRSSTEVVGLIHDEDADGAVIGVECKRRTTMEVIGARQGVVFGSGGFLHNTDLARTFLRGPVFGGAAAPTATGDLIPMAAKAGAQFGNMTHAWWDQVVLGAALRQRSTSRDCVIPFGDSMVIVNRHGERVMNEKAPYADRGQVHFYWNADTRAYENLLLFMIFDDVVARDQRASERVHRYPAPISAMSEPDVISADSWGELTKKVAEALNQMGEEVGGFSLADNFEEGLRTTLLRWREMSAAGVDLDHRRGESAIEKLWATSPRTDSQFNPTMHAFDESGPYHCVILAPGALDTKGGPVTDEAARILDHAGHPIPGLLGAGNCVASVTGQGYYGPGGTIGPALVFGWIAGVTASEEEPRRPSFA